MSDLAKIQRDLCESVRGHGTADFRKHIKPTTIEPDTSLAIYHNNIFSVHAKALQNDYPLVLWILTQIKGGEAVRAVLPAYVEVNLPCTGSLDDWGGGFARFIQSYTPVASIPCLGEIAQYEWAKQEAYAAEEKPLLTAKDRQKYTTCDAEGTVFSFQNSCRLLAFSHPLEQIIAAHQDGKGLEEALSQQGSSYVLIFKHKGVIKVHWLSPALFAFLDRLKEGQDIEVAFAAAQVLEPDFDVQAAFVFLFTHPILCL
jgi:hypothetical protein